MDRVTRLSRHQEVNTFNQLSGNAVRIAIENALEAAIAKGVKEIGGVPADQWAENLKGRIGREPLFRLMFILLRDMASAKSKNGPIVLADVLCEDPTLWVQCSKDLNLQPYFAVYQPHYL
jgi:hypothetical protein